MNPLFAALLLTVLSLMGADAALTARTDVEPVQSDVANDTNASASRDSSGPEASDDVPVYTYKIVNTYPHDRSAFTQGLVFDDGVLYEGTGLFGRSSLRKVDLKTGKILKLYNLPGHFFGEGVTAFGSRIAQSTWKSNVAFIYDKRSFRLLQVFKLPAESWGLTHDGKHLIMSDGTPTLRFLDPRTFQQIDRIEVRDKNGPVSELNELEYVRGEIYANVWKTERIARIAPDTGQVTGWIDLEGLLTPEDRSQPVDVLNGIAYDAENDRLFVTGKLWPKLFEIELSLRALSSSSFGTRRCQREATGEAPPAPRIKAP